MANVGVAAPPQLAAKALGQTQNNWKSYMTMANTQAKPARQEFFASLQSAPIQDGEGIQERDENAKPSGRGSSQPTRKSINGGVTSSDVLPKQSVDDNSDNGHDESSLDTAKRLSASLKEDDFSNNNNKSYDMVCIGMGPASLAIGIALADALHRVPLCKSASPKVLFLEKQTEFAWHPGMQIPDAKMQISFLKDLATPRDPTSPFSFVNYLHKHGRFYKFLNLGTFLPSRLEYQAYMRWCADHFEDATRYGAEVIKVAPVFEQDEQTLKTWRVTYRRPDGTSFELLSRHVVMAAGGQPRVPQVFEKHYRSQDWQNPCISHSSQYRTAFRGFHLPGEPVSNLVVIGSGQSAAEIYSDLCGRYPNGNVTLICRGAALKPSDDSPFVNEVFDPERVDGFYGQPREQRQEAIIRDKATNYSVVRSELIEHIYYHQYMQDLQEPDATKHKHRILFNTQVKSIDEAGLLTLENSMNAERADEFQLPASHVFLATGYKRDLHSEVLAETRQLLPSNAVFEDRLELTGQFPIGRDYRIKYDEGRVPPQCGIWLQGCNEATHGLSDSLLSILAVRGGELVKSIFGADHEYLQR